MDIPANHMTGDNRPLAGFRAASFLRDCRTIVMMAAVVAAVLGGCAMREAKDAGTSLITYDAPKEIAASPFYTVAVNGRPVFVYPCQVGTIVDDKGNLIPNRHELTAPAPAAFCSFDFSGQVEVAVTVKGPALHLPLRSAIVRPLRHGIQPKVTEATLRFSLDRPCSLSVEPNGAIAAPLFVFANPLEEQRPRPEDPGVVYFPPGVHDLNSRGPVRPNTTIYIAGGAVVYGQLDAENVSGVRVKGRGILDASRCAGGRQMRWFKCRDIVVEGIVMLDSPSWGIEVTHCDDVRIRNVKIITGRGADAIDVCSSENVIVEQVFARTHDDTLNVKGLTDLAFGYPADKDGHWLPTGNRKAARNIRFTDCVVWNDRAHALMIGPETRTPVIEDVVFKNIEVIHALSVHALAIFSGDAGVIRRIRYEGIRIEDPRCQDLFGIRIHPTYVSADPHCGPVYDVLYKDIDVSMTSPVYSGFCGDSNEISRVRFENLRINGKIVTSAEEARLIVRGKVSDVRFVTSGQRPD